MMQSKAKLECQREDWGELRDCQYIRFIKFSSAIDYLKKKKLHHGKLNRLLEPQSSITRVIQLPDCVWNLILT